MFDKIIIGENMELDNIKGIGPKRLELLNKLNIRDVEDLLYYFPYRYNILKRSNINELEQDDKVVIDGYLEENAKIIRYGHHQDKMSFRFNTGTNLLNVCIFNRGFLKSKLVLGTSITIIGKYDKNHNTIIASDIRFSSLPEYTIIETVYHEKTGIGSKQINDIVKECYQYINIIPNLLPSYLEDKYNFIDKYSSIIELHNPTSTKNYNKALNRMKFEELFVFMYKMNYLKIINKNRIGLERHVDISDINKFIDSLPFSLTVDQKEAVKDIYNDLINKNRMNRLLQGDVGSGKTIISFIALYINFLSNYQGALMAPTEILAEQHYNNIKNIFKDYNIRIALLTGKLSKREKEKIYKNLELGNIDILIGTVAIIEDKIKYKNLGLVITDEQHRFGVNQRSIFKNKGVTPDVLYMSATPIPRTYALTLYGDMDVSSIKTMPNGRKEIKTLLYTMKEIKEVLTSIYKELKNKHQVYVVAPLIEENGDTDLLNVYKLETDMKKAFVNYNIGVLHGKMTSKEKEDIMTKYKNNEIQVLISTTVIEVGVDIKNATMMVVFDAYRFGLSTLHQLRGRVGRNDLQSYCLLVSDKEATRLDVLTKTSDGYKISEEDFKLRGSGDLLGIRQSGDMSFKLSDLKSDYNILLKAKEEVEYSINNDLITNELKNELTKLDNLD